MNCKIDDLSFPLVLHCPRYLKRRRERRVLQTGSLSDGSVAEGFLHTKTPGSVSSRCRVYQSVQGTVPVLLRTVPSDAVWATEIRLSPAM